MAQPTGGDTSQLWLDLRDAAKQVRLPYQELVDAVAGHELPATTEHPARLGTWMVRSPVLEAWAASRLAIRSVPEQACRTESSARG